MMGFSPRDLKRMLKRMGVEVEELNVLSIELKLGDGRTLVVEDPQSVALMKARGQPGVIYIVGGNIVEKKEEPEEEAHAVEVSEEDVELVAEQAGVSKEEAKRALIEAGGDIAEAILRLKGEA